jgi:uroporphyrinogen III methyltransferase/synthase
LVEAGLRFEVVPGVTSALAAPAYAGIPVTHRDWVSGVTVLTGHEAPGWEGRVRWEHVATAGNTIVLLMGLTQLRGNLARLLEAGLPPDTPAAAIRWASSPAQQVVCATARELTEVVERHGFRPPVTVVIGQVVLLRERLHWFERRPLFGRRVLVTRARAQASALTGLLVEQGAEVIECPAIEIEPLESRELDVALANLARYDWLIFTSRNGVERFFSRLRALDWDVRALHAARLAAIGPETARALEERLLKVDVMAEDFRAEGLLEAMARQRLRGSRILLPRAEGAREVLTDELRANGAQVDEIATYRSVVPGASVAILRAALTKRLDCLSFTSSSTVKHFFHLLELACGQDGRERICQARIACIGPITAATAVRAGLAVHIVPDQYTVPALARAIAEDFSKRRES